MSDSNQVSSNQGGPAPRKPRKSILDLSTEIRLLIAFALMGVVMIATQYLLPSSSPQPKSPTKAETAKADQAPPPPPDLPREKPAESVSVSSAAATRGQIGAASESPVVVETGLYRVTLSNRGAVVRSWLLKEHTDSTGKPLELVNLKAVEKVGYPLAVRLKDGQDAAQFNQALWRTEVSGDGLSVTFEYSDGSWYAKKSLRFQKTQYLCQVQSEFRHGSSPKPHLLLWRGGFGDATVIGAAASQHSVHFDVSANKLTVKSAGDAKEAPVVDRGNYSFAGIEDAYFAAVALPESPSGFEIWTLSDQVPNALDGKEEANAGVAVGGEDINSFALFVGPKDTDLLRRISPRLEQLVDFGWFSFMAKPLFLGLHWLHDHWIHNWGWSIVVITVFINFALLPLKISSLKSMKQMQLLQPKIAAINEKYKGLSLRDPKKQQQNQEVMDLYKKHGVNPMGGCVPMLLQIPFFIAFYKVLSVAIELRGADWLWVNDLSRPEDLPIRILPVTMTVTQFILQRMTPSTSVDPAQQRIMMLMPLMFAFMFYGVSSGLVLYWLTGNIVGIGQQWFFNRTFHAPAGAEAAARKAEAPAKKKGSNR